MALGSRFPYLEYYARIWPVSVAFRGISDVVA